MEVSLYVNGKDYTIDVDPEMPLLWAIRENLVLTGTKFGCGIGQCGACMVHLDGQPVRSCSIPVSFAEKKKITTIEGLSSDNSHPVQQAWINEQVPQCGYCQSGQIMSAVALLAQTPQPSEEEIHASMKSVLCRCGTYPRIVRAIQRVANS